MTLRGHRTGELVDKIALNLGENGVIVDGDSANKN